MKNMGKITVREILLKKGSWTKSSDLVHLVSKERNVTLRQAYNLIKESYKQKEILKHIFRDGTVIYGLSEFGPPISIESKKRKLIKEPPLWIKQFFEHKDIIMRIIGEQDQNELAKVPQATLNFLKADLPSEIKKEFPELEKLENTIKWVYKQKDVDLYQTRRLRNQLLKNLARNIVPEIYGKAQDLVLKYHSEW
jgi:hypothetical protein